MREVCKRILTSGEGGASADDIKKYNRMIKNAYGRLVQEDPNFMQLDVKERSKKAQDYVADWLVTKARQRREQVIKNAAVMARRTKELDAVAAKGGSTAKYVLGSMSRSRTDTQTFGNNLFNNLAAVRELALDRLTPVGVKNRLNLFEVRIDPRKTDAWAAALDGREVAPEFAADAELMRNVMSDGADSVNAAGGNIDKRTAHVPQSMIPSELIAGRHEMFADEALRGDHIIKDMYTKEVNGELIPKTDAEIREVLIEVSKSMAGELRGAKGKASGRPSDMGLNRERVIHYKSVSDYVALHRKFGSNPDIVGDVQKRSMRMAEEAFLIREWGTNYRENLETFFNKALELDASKTADRDVGTARAVLSSLMDGNIHDQDLAKRMQMLRDVLAGLRLWGGGINSIPDSANLYALAARHHISFADTSEILARNLKDTVVGDFMLRGNNGQAEGQAIVARYMQSAMLRSDPMEVGATKASLLASAAVKYSGLAAVQAAIRKAEAEVVTRYLAREITAVEWGKLPDGDKAAWSRMGFNEDVYSAITEAHKQYLDKASPDEQFAYTWVDDLPEEFFLRRAAQRWATGIKKDGTLNARVEAKIRADALALRDKTRTAMYSFVRDHVAFTSGELSGQQYQAVYKQAGSFAGEATRTMTQFVVSPMLSLYNNLMSVPDGSNWISSSVYRAKHLSMLMALGVAVVQANAILNGQTFVPFTDEEDPFGVNAELLAAGATRSMGVAQLMGVFSNNPYEQMQAYSSAFGPMFAYGVQASTAALSVGRAVVTGESTDAEHAVDNVLRLGKSSIPAMNWTATKLATDHLIWQQIQRELAPEILDRRNERIQELYGNDFWWKPGDATPQIP